MPIYPEDRVLELVVSREVDKITYEQQETTSTDLKVQILKKKTRLPSAEINASAGWKGRRKRLAESESTTLIPAADLYLA